MADALLAYDPALLVRGERFDFGNGVRLTGPVGLTPELSATAGLPAGMRVAYYADIVATAGPPRPGRTARARRLDAERLIRGLAARVGGVVHDRRPPARLDLEASVYSVQPLPAEQVISVLQPYAGGALFVRENGDAAGACHLVSRGEPRFRTVYWPPRRSRLHPPLALGTLREQELCRWELRSGCPAEQAGRAIRLVLGEAALALAAQASGKVTDVYGFPVTRPADLLPRLAQLPTRCTGALAPAETYRSRPGPPGPTAAPRSASARTSSPTRGHTPAGRSCPTPGRMTSRAPGIAAAVRRAAEGRSSGSLPPCSTSVGIRSWASRPPYHLAPA